MWPFGLPISWWLRRSRATPSYSLGGLTTHSLTHRSSRGPTSVLLLSSSCPQRAVPYPSIGLLWPPSRVGDIRAGPPGHAISLHVSLNALRAYTHHVWVYISLYILLTVPRNPSIHFIHIFLSSFLFHHLVSSRTLVLSYPYCNNNYVPIAVLG